jgi:Ca2+-binding EF-hand superfamily protein
MAVHRIWFGTIAWVIAGSPAIGQQKAEMAGPKPIARAQFIVSMDSEFRKVDADKNGQLTAAEIEQSQKLQAVASAQARNRTQFTELDTDRNGQLSPAEFAKLAPPPVAANAQPVLAKMDGNRDGQVSLVEYRIATLANFDRLDADRNGTVTPAEMKAGGITPR